MGTNDNEKEIDTELNLSLVVEVDPFTVIKNNSCDDVFHAEDANKELETEILPTVAKSDRNLNPMNKDCVDDEDFPQCDDSDANSNYPQTCGVYGCDKKVFSSCHLCMSLLCTGHFLNIKLRENDHTIIKQRKIMYRKIVKSPTADTKNPPAIVIPETKEPPIVTVAETGGPPIVTLTETEGLPSVTIAETEGPPIVIAPETESPPNISILQAENISAVQISEDFCVAGPKKKYKAESRIVKKRENMKKKAHENRARGDAYIIPKTGKMVPSRKILKPRCNGITCAKLNKKCLSFSEENREQILQGYYGTESLQLQREFIARFVKVQDIKQRTVKSDDSRRSVSYYYFLPKDKESVPVCKTMFLNTLNISEKGLRTALKKKDSTGIIEKDKRGGRRQSLKVLDEQRTSAILEHISKFLEMESHYCHKEYTDDSLYPHLNKKKMHQMFLDEYKAKGISASYDTYIKLLKSQIEHKESEAKEYTKENSDDL